jgi:peroxiredoxin
VSTHPLPRVRLTRRLLLLATGANVLPVACASAQLPPSRSSKHLGEPLPAFAGITVNGSEFDSNSSRGLVLFVEFFDGSRDAPRALADASTLYGDDRELVVCGVSLDPSIESARGFVSRQGVKFPVLFDPERSVAERLGVSGPGTGLAVDRRGILRWVGDPATPHAVRDATEALLGESA